MGTLKKIGNKFKKFSTVKTLEKTMADRVNLLNHQGEKIDFPIYENPEVSIIIPFYNQENFTRNCLFSIFKNLPKSTFEIILINDNSSEICDFSNFGNIRIINNVENLGFLKSVNTAIPQARGRFIYLLNNDTQVTAGFLDELKFVFHNFENVGTVGSMMLNPDGSLQEAGAVFMSGSRISQVVGRKKPYYPEFNYIYPVDYCSGCSLLFEKLREDGSLCLFDEIFAPAYFEDTDLCFDIRYRRKKEVYYTPFSKIIHFNGVSYNSNIEFSAKKQELFDKNFALFKKKWNTQLNAINAEKPQDRILELSGGKSVVFYNGVVPEFDKNSGDLRLTEIIKAYKQKAYFVAIVPAQSQLGSRYTEYFQRLGVCVYLDHTKFGGRKSFLKRLRLKKPVNWFYAVRSFLENYRVVSQANPDGLLVYDMVDVHHLRHKMAAELEPDCPSHRRKFKKYFRREIFAAKKCDVLVAISDDEENYMKNFVQDSKIVALSNVHYLKKTLAEVPTFHQRKDVLFVGSIHPPNIDAVMFLAKEIMPEVWKTNPEILLHIVGNVNGAVPEMKHPKIKFHGYVDDMEHFLLHSRIMLAPLRYGAGVKGKIGQAFEYQLPVVTTTVGAEGMQIVNGRNAMVANSAADFSQKILALYSDEKLWEDLQNNSEESLQPFSRQTLLNKIDEIESKR